MQKKHIFGAFFVIILRLIESKIARSTAVQVEIWVYRNSPVWHAWREEARAAIDRSRSFNDVSRRAELKWTSFECGRPCHE